MWLVVERTVDVVTVVVVVMVVGCGSVVVVHGGTHTQPGGEVIDQEVRSVSERRVCVPRSSHKATEEEGE